MSRYIDADELRLVVFNHANRQYCEGNHDKEKAFIHCLYLIDCMPVFEVVRCKDWKWYKSIFSWNCKEHKVCVREPSEPPREPNDYCSFGERREE